MEMITENSAQENAQTANVTKALQSPEFSDKMAMYCLIMSYLDRLLDDGVLTKEEYERAYKKYFYRHDYNRINRRFVSFDKVYTHFRGS